MLKEKAEELVLGKVIEKIDEYKSKKEWSNLFVNTGEFLLQNVDGGEGLIEDISTLLSSDNMMEMARKIDKGNKYEFRETLYRELQRLMLQYEIPAQEATFYISNFMNVIMNELEKANPDVFQSAYLGDWRQMEEKELLEIKQELVRVNTQLQEIQKRKADVVSLDQMEIELAKRTVNPCINLDFFEIDDENFFENFVKKLDEECIYISGKCKEEIIFGILNELRKLKTGRMVLVIKREEDWENLRIANEENPELNGKILIPWFHAEQIYAIPKNTNIFVYGEEEYCVGKDEIRIRKRTRNTIIRKLERAGVDHQTAYKMVEDTHGLYIPLKKKLIRGKYNILPNWVNGKENIIIPLLLCGQWTEAEGDRIVLEDLCEMPYEQILYNLKPYMKGEDPLFIKYRTYGEVTYRLASVENAWEYLEEKVCVGDKIWKKYVECILTIVPEPDPVFDFPEDKQCYIELLPEGTPFWSSTLKKGLLRSLIMKAYYKNNSKNQSIVDNIVAEILKSIKSLNQWLSIAQYFSTLCEASPKAVIQRLDCEWDNDTGLIGVFLRPKEDFLFHKNYYTHFIWGIEQFLYQTEYVAWAVRWFLKMHDIGIKYSINNSPKATLKQIFCPWINVTVLTQKEKIYLAKEAFNKKYDVWELFYEELPGRKNNMVGKPSKPRYRNVKEDLTVTHAELAMAYKGYISLCLENMEFNPKRWEKMIEAAVHFSPELISVTFEKLKYELIYMTDAEVISIKNKIRGEIYRHRYFCNSDWSMKEEEVVQFESLLLDIKTKNPVYEYAYLFTNTHDFPLLHRKRLNFSR